MPDIPEPVRVSPIIKFFRYAFLGTGILYGASKLKAMRVMEEGRKEERERKRIEREAILVEEKKAASERDIAAIVAIFKGTSDTDPSTTDQSNIPQANKLEKEELKEVKQIVHPDNSNTISDDLSTCTVEEVKQIVQNDNTPRSPTVNTEFGSVEQKAQESKPDSECPKEDPVDKNKGDKGDIFSTVFNLTTSDSKKGDSQVKPGVRIIIDESGTKVDASETNEGKQSQDSGYFVETFSDNVPFVQPKTMEDDFYRKDDK